MILRLIWALTALLALAACSAPRDSVAPASPATLPASNELAEPGAKNASEPFEPSDGNGTADALAQAGDVDYTCRTDADCTIKDVGSCCGYRPACVNLDSPTFPERVKAECAASGTSGICGFPSISGCQCVAGHCEGINAAATSPVTTH